MIFRCSFVTYTIGENEEVMYNILYYSVVNMFVRGLYMFVGWVKIGGLKLLLKIFLICSL